MPIFCNVGGFVFHYLRLFSVLFLLVNVSIVSAEQEASTQATPAKLKPPKLIQLSYEVTKNAKPFAKVTEQFSLSANTYKIESVTKGIGIYALFGERKLISTGELTEQGLRPNHFELHQGDNVKKSLIADFDWVSNVLHMQGKGKVSDVPLIIGTQDLASYAYQFMFLPLSIKEALVVTLTTGKKLNQYAYKINTAPVTLTEVDTRGASVDYKTLHLQLDLTKAKAESKELWLATDHYYLPVKIMMVDESGAKIEQTLTELHVE